MLGPARCFCFAILSPSMRMGSVSQERPVAQSPQLSKDGEVLKESSEANGAREKASVERANEKKEAILWKALRTAAAAVEIERYFRSGPKNPSLHDIMMNIEVPAGSVNKEFLRMASVVAERFVRQRQDVDAAMTALTERAAAGRSQVANQEIAQLVYKQINPKLPPSRGALQLARRDGYFLLTVGNQSDYHALYDEDTDEKKSGGRFHRALHITIAGREVPVIVHPGSTIFNEDTNKIMIHEKQHWINESLVKLGFVESERPLFLTIPIERRKAALLKEDHHRAIKDEMLAYLREGHVKDIKKTLFGDLYKHLFSTQPTDEREQEDRNLVTKISDEFSRCSDILVANKDLRTAMVYVLMGVRLRRFPEYLASMRGLLERIATLQEAAIGDQESDLTDVEMLPSAYRNDHVRLQSREFGPEVLIQKAWQAQYGFSFRDDSRSFLALRKEIKTATDRRGQCFEAITQGEVFPPYLMKIGYNYLSEEEESVERDLRTDILDALSSVTNASLQNICRMQNIDEELLVISGAIKNILKNYGRTGPAVTFSVADKGVQVHVQYQVLQPPDSVIEISNTYVLTRSRTAGFSKTPRAREWDFDDAVVRIPDVAHEPKSVAPPVRQTREITAARADAIAIYLDEHWQLEQAMREKQPHYDVVRLAQNVQSSRNVMERTLQPFIRNGTHIPDVQRVQGVDFWDGQITSLPTAKAIDGLRNTLFDIASAYPQESIDGALVDVETEADPDVTDRVQKQFDALMVKQLGSRQFGVGMIKNIRCSGVYLGDVAGTLGARVSFEAQRQTGGFIPASVDVIFHRTAV